MRRQTIPLLPALSFCLLVLLLVLIPNWDSHSISASQDKTTESEVAAAIEEQIREAADLARSELAELKFQELNAKAQLGGMVSVIVKLRVAFRPEGELLIAARVQAQRAVIAQIQDSLMKELTGYDPASLKRYEYGPYVAVKVNAAGLEELRLSSSVIDIHEDKRLRPSLAESVPLINAPSAWENGYTGAGKTIAILDTGVDKTHPFLAGKVVSEACYSTSDTASGASSLCPGGVSESTSTDSGLNCTEPSECNHGTHVAGIAAGVEGVAYRLSGVAKGANLISIQVFSQIDDSTSCGGTAPCLRSFTSDLMKGLERVYALRDTHSIASVNLSLGEGRFTSNCDTNPLKSVIDQLRSVGIATVVASGNDRYSDALNSPACISSAISVGATGDTITSANSISPFSNSAPFLSLLAPGVPIISSTPNGGFTTLAGTSMAAPHVAGAWAILKQQNPIASVTELLNRLTSRGFPVTDPRNNVTTPRLNLGPPPGCVANVSENHWKGEYYSNTGLAGSPAMIRDDGADFLNFDIGVGNPGAACDLGADNFSVRWTRTVLLPVGKYRITLTADDGVRLYVGGRLIIDKWFAQAPTTYTAEMFFNGGAHFRLEYFEASANAVARLSWENLSEPGCYADFPPSDHWSTEIFNGRFEDDPLVVRDDGPGFLNFDIGAGSPAAACGLGTDNFSARFQRLINVTSGVYRFTVTVDDGVQFFIDGKLIIDKYFTQPATTYTADVFLPTGIHQLGLLYFEATGEALARVSWERVSPAGCFADIPLELVRWKGEFYNSTDLSGNPVMIRDDGEAFLDFDFGVGSPSAVCGLTADNFSARWTRRVNLPPGGYRFTVTADDGVRLWIDGRLVIDKWFHQPASTYTVDGNLMGGGPNGNNHEFKLEYFEGGGNAVAKLSWESVETTGCFTVVPGQRWRGEYFSNTNLMGEPLMIRDDGGSSLNFDIGSGNPGESCGLSADNFSARWTQTFNISQGPYRFTVIGDDGVRLYIDGKLVIDKWFAQAATIYTVIVYIDVSGNHEVKLEYFENTGEAVARLSMERLPLNCISNVPSGHWKGEYYNNTDLTGNPAMVLDDGDGFLGFEFDGGGPRHCGIGVDNFSARWTRTINFAPGSYRFTVTADDGVRLYVGGQLIIDKWFGQAPTTYTADVLIPGGSQEIKLEYYERLGGAVARLNWALISGP
jgi:subtilisin